MKYMFISDIHGNLENLEKYIEIFEKEGADKLILLGDTSDGDYDDNDYLIAETINSLGSKVEIIRGNRDWDEFLRMIKQETFEDDTLPFYTSKGEYIFITFTHGHIYNYNRLPPNCGKVFIQGHTHVPMLLESGGRILANPGSPTRPRGLNQKCYIMLDEEEISLVSVDGEVLNRIAL